MGDSTCVACGECVQACPTGALMPARDAGKIVPDKQVDSVCPYCGVGCQLTYNIKDNTILYVQGKDGPANSSRLCVKGRYGFDYVQHKHRLTKPLIRKPGVPKHKDFVVDPDNWREVFREATWEEALDVAAKGFREIRDTYGKRSLAGFGSAKCTNEEAYLFQKLVRTGFGSNNVDHCTRLCHASSVAALMEGINSGAVSNQVRDVANAEVIFLIGANPTVNHPVAATWIKNAAKAGVKLIVADPRRSDLARHATYYLQFNADTDVALLNAMLHVIVEEGLADEAFIRDRTSGYEALAENVKKFSPETMAPICGIDAKTIREVARLYATSKASIILWGMGISQHVHGTDNARCLIALALSTGQIGKPGSGLHPLRGQNNVQGASDSGLIPMFYPDYQRVGTPEARQRFEKLWRTDARSGSRPHCRRNHATPRRNARFAACSSWAKTPRCPIRTWITRAKRLPLSIIWSCRISSSRKPRTSPTSCWPLRRGPRRSAPSRIPIAWCSWGARRLNRPATPRKTSGFSTNWPAAWVLTGITAHPREVFNEMRTCMDSIAGITWDRLERESSVTYPCVKEGDPGRPGGVH